MSPAKSRAGLDGPIVVANVGAELFAEEFERQGVPVERVEWRPPTPGAEAALEVFALHSAAIGAANDRALERLGAARPLLRGIATAGEAIAGLDDRTLLHAGPPIEWGEMSGPLRGAVVGALIYEGHASSAEEAERRAGAGEFEFAPCHEHGAVGPMAGVVSASMPVWVVENEAGGNRAHCTLNEGLGKVLRYGAFGREVIERLRWMSDVLAPVLADAVASLEQPIDLRAMIAQTIQMGDECHNRNRAATSLLIRELAAPLLDLDRAGSEVASAVRFIAGNDHFFLNLSMPAAKVAADAAAGIPASSLVTAMARNGTEFGIRLSGTGERWFTGPAGQADGLYLPGFGPADANPDIGDSSITETFGLGGFAMAAAPAIVEFVGGSAADALATTEEMYGITMTESGSFRVPALGFRGTPTGIDCRAVVHTGVLPAINTGIAHREPGIGQIGAGLVEPPMRAFVEAAGELARSLDGGR